MSNPNPFSHRFHVLEFSPMALRDTETGANIHLGSQIEARELCELLTTLQESLDAYRAKCHKYELQVKAMSLAALRNTGKINFLELEIARIQKHNDEEHF